MSGSFDAGHWACAPEDTVTLLTVQERGTAGRVLARLKSSTHVLKSLNNEHRYQKKTPISESETHCVEFWYQTSRTETPFSHVFLTRVHL